MPLVSFARRVVLACLVALPAALHAATAVPLPDVSSVTGAVIDESVVARTYHVDPVRGDDSFDGSSPERAFRTLAAGVAAARSSVVEGTPTRLRLQPGIYRESVTADFDAGKGRDTLLVIEGAAKDQVILEGADVFPAEGWTDLGDGLYSHDWPYSFGHYFLNNANQILESQRAEMVFVDGEPLLPRIVENHRYVNDPRRAREKRYDYLGFRDPAATLEPGTFAVAEREENGRRLFVRLPALASIERSRIEVSVRPSALVLRNKGNLVLRNLVVRRAANLLNQYPIDITAWRGRSLFSENFSENRASATWRVNGGEYRFFNDKIDQPGHTGGQRVDSIPVLETETDGLALASRDGLAIRGDAILRTRLKLDSATGEAGLVVGRTGEAEGLALVIAAESPATARLYRLGRGGQRALLREAPFVLEPGEYAWLEARLIGGRLTVRANGRAVITHEGDALAGEIGLINFGARARFAELAAEEWVAPPRNILVEDCAFDWNSSAGFRVANQSGITLRRSRFNHNGYHGIVGDRVENILLEDNETNFNNWRGHLGGWSHTSRFVAAAKWHWTDRQIVRRHTSVGNLTYGFWHDIHCHDIRIEDFTAALNTGYGMFFEISYGPFLLERGLLAANGRFDLYSAMAGSVTVRDSILASATSQAPFDYHWYVRRDPHWADEPFFAQGYTLLNNVLHAPASARVHSLRVGVPAGDYRYAPAVAANRGSRGNLYFGANPQTAFHAPDANGKPADYDLAGFMRRGGETEARWADPRFVDAATLDFRLAPDSPLRSRASSLPARRIPDTLLPEADTFFLRMGIGLPVPSRGQALRVRILDEGGITSRRFSLTTPTPSAEIRYTLDGGEPTARSPLYREPLVLEKDALIRARAFASGMKPSSETALRARVNPDAPTGELSAVAAAFVRGGSYSNDNYIRQSTLEAKDTNAPDYKREIHLLFDLRALPADFTRAALRLQCNRSDGGENTLWLAPGSGKRGEWAAESLTWNRRPPKTRELAAFPVPPSGGLVEVDVTEIVREHQRSGRMLSFLIEGGFETWTHYTARGPKGPRLFISRE